MRSFKWPSFLARALVGVPWPEQGYVAAFAEAVFGRGRHACSFSTNLAILGSSDDTGPRPLGHSGICRAP